MRCICLQFSTRTYISNIISNVPDISNDLKPLEHVIRHKLIKSILNGYKYNGTERNLFTHPAKHGDLSIYDPAKRYQIEFKNYRLVTRTMVKKIENQDKIYDKLTKKS